jgi:maleate isomerase
MSENSVTGGTTAAEWQLHEHLPFSTDTGSGSVARVGVIVLASDFTIDREFRQIFTDPAVDYYTARVENSMTITPQTLAAMESRIPAALQLILPGERLDVVAYGCTSATTVLGEDVVQRRICEVQPEARVTTPITAAFAAFRALGAKRIAVLTPYRSDVNEVVHRYITSAGFEVPVFGSFNEEQDPIVARIDQRSISNAVDQLVADAEVDMVFVSCTSVRLLDSVAALEQRIGMPVTSSNLAMAWHSLRLCGVTKAMPQWGQLYERPLLT